MVKKTAVVAALAGAAIAVGGAFAASATAQDAPSGGLGNNACVAPWNWNGPGTLGLSDNTSAYEACNGAGDAAEGGVNLFNNACLLPWMWNGPFNAMLTGNTNTYSACNS